jgi:BirA family transcriptional regulator, biotin operon repressor / biotin---[acetyl-CoA-carboxylase] ligase
MAELLLHAGGIPVVTFETVGSTNAEAIERARSGEHGPLWIVAQRQTAGRGRRGRNWDSEPGNLYASLLLTDPAAGNAVSGICFVAALALHDALVESVHGLAPAQLKLKWPNDVLLDGRKLAGILVEGVSLERGAVAVVGFGVNCKRHPASTEFPATDLQATGYVIEPASLLSALGRSMNARIAEWRRGENFSAIRAAWLSRATGIGRAIEVRLADKKVAGTFEAIDPRGALVLLLRDGTRETIAAGDVFPLTAA